MSDRSDTLGDRVIINLDRALRTLFGGARTTGRPNPADAVDEAELTPEERRHAAGLMRVNHAGEVAAQALYHGQALTARSRKVRESMDRSAVEENDHLAWCESRLTELGSRPSLLDPAWYLGSLTIGTLAGLAGDKWSLGFVAETEKQVVKHLEGHLQSLPPADARSRAIVDQMKEDEGHHASKATRAGGAPLPYGIRRLMKHTARVMTRTAYRL